MRVVHVFEPGCSGKIIGRAINLDTVNWNVNKKKKDRKKEKEEL